MMDNSDERRGRVDWSRRGWVRVYVVTLLGTLACVAIVMIVDLDHLLVPASAERTRALLVDTLLPTLLAAPAFFFFLKKIRELAVAEAKLKLYASTDSLTAVLNRGAFTAHVDSYLRNARGDEEPLHGALLVIDADHFKQVNDRFGHDAGDVALRLIADAIKGLLRGPDLVGRMGGEEFGVFLPGATAEQAESVAERIRQAVSSLEFRPGGEWRSLSVSVGGATFAGRIGFSELYRIADQRLYAAKDHGRNRVSLVSAEAYANAA
jgi:diguanylate cyclase (GGDEF)-like protein